jgi:hypothetical protein
VVVEPKFPWLRIHRKKHIPKLREALKNCEYNCFSVDHVDRNGNPISILAFDFDMVGGLPGLKTARVDRRLGVWFANANVAQIGMELIHEHVQVTVAK